MGGHAKCCGFLRNPLSWDLDIKCGFAQERACPQPQINPVTLGSHGAPPNADDVELLRRGEDAEAHRQDCARLGAQDLQRLSRQGEDGSLRRAADD